MTTDDASLLVARNVVAGRGTFRTGPLDINIERGESAALVGRSGAGKTSMLRTLGGVTPPRSGEIMRRSPSALCFQEPRLLPWRSAIENVLFGIGRRATSDEHARASRLLDELGLAGLTDRSVADLSGGQRRRIAIARTLVVGAPLVLVDEPFTQLDDDSASLVERSLVAHVAQGGGLVIAVHAPGGARSTTDRFHPVAAAE